jgi:hypothetical protein
MRLILSALLVVLGWGVLDHGAIVAAHDPSPLWPWVYPAMGWGMIVAGIDLWVTTGRAKKSS